jgi:twitching motility protein PilU
MDIDGLLGCMADLGAADLFLKVPVAPTYKISGLAQPTDLPPVNPEEMEELARKVLRPRDLERFHTCNQVDCSYSVQGVGRFRGNVYRQRGTVAMVFRRINTSVPTADDLGLPETLKGLAMERRGLVLVTGATGSGKSTTLAAMIDWRNENSQGHIVTIEDPIEFLHPDKGCVVSQREVGVDVDSFHDALKAALRQAPDVLLMGEIRDGEAAETALHLSETGHLVLGTLHSTNANQSVERMLQFFSPDRHPEILSLLAFNLRGIVSQRLIRGLDGKYCMAAEILVGTPRVRELLKRGQVAEMKMAIAQGDRDGMQTFDQAIYELFLRGHIDQESALLAADSPNDLRLKMRGFVAGGR